MYAANISLGKYILKLFVCFIFFYHLIFGNDTMKVKVIHKLTIVHESYESNAVSDKNEREKKKVDHVMSM